MSTAKIQDWALAIDERHHNAAMKALMSSDVNENNRHMQMCNAAYHVAKSAYARSCTKPELKRIFRADSLQDNQEKWIARHNRRHHL